MPGGPSDPPFQPPPVMPGPDQPSALSAGPFPCDVALILRDHCTACHGATLAGGAPMPLVRPDDFHVERNGQQVAVTVMQRVRDPVRPMPLPPDTPLAAAQIATLDAWIQQGSPAVANGCDGAAPPPMPVMPPVMPAAGTNAAPPTPMTDAGTTMPPDTGEPSGATWSMFGHDLANTRSNPAETRIGPDNVAGLRVLWDIPVPSTTSTPAVVDGVVYLPAWDGKVYARNVDDGSEVWTAPLPALIDSSPAVTADRVYVADDKGELHALDRATGMKMWSFEVDMHPETHLWSSPVYVEEANLLVIGSASSDEALPPGMQTFRGSVVGVDAAAGTERWRFDTTSDGSGPGVAVWATAAVDTVRKLVFIGTGNNYVAPAGKYADALIAVDYETGQLAWATQFTANDVFIVSGGTGPDADIGSTANLFSAGGKDLVGIGVKNGKYYALDRDTGAMVWSATVSMGSVLGGVISASAYHDGMIFVAGNKGVFGDTHLVALRATDGSEAWFHDAPMSTWGGIAHANGLVYLSTTSGMTYALDEATGDVRWSDMAPGAIAGSPSIVDGTLFVPWGYQWTLRGGVPGTGGLIAYGL